MTSGKIRLWCVVTIVSIFPALSVQAASSYYTGVFPYGATDIPGDTFTGFDVTASGKIVGLAGRDINLYSSSGVFERSIATVPDYNGEASAEYGAFCRLSPDEGRVWVGLTVAGNTDDRIYSVPFAGGAVTHEATLPGNYDLEWYQVGGAWKPFVSGGTWSGANSVWLLDTSGGAHTKVAETGGYGTGIAFDNEGRLYAANQTTLKLYRFGAADVQAAAQGLATFLVVDNAGFMTDTLFAVSDITVDGADHVFFNGNDPNWSGASLVAMLRPDYVGTYRYDNIALGSGLSGNWSLQMAFGGDAGDVLLGQGAVYVADYYSTGGVTVFHVPEPASVVLLSGGLAVLGACFRRRIR